MRNMQQAAAHVHRAALACRPRCRQRLACRTTVRYVRQSDPSPLRTVELAVHYGSTRLAILAHSLQSKLHGVRCSSRSRWCISLLDGGLVPCPTASRTAGCVLLSVVQLAAM